MRRFLLVFAIYFVVPNLSALAATPQKASAFVHPAELAELSTRLSYPGRVKSKVNAATTSDIEGQVVRISKNLGSKVKRGEVILTLQNTDPVYRYAPIKMRSPSDGYLTTLDVSLLAKVERGQKLYTITDPHDLVVEVEIPASDLSSMRLGMEGLFKPSSQSTESLRARIEGLSPIVDIKTGTATAEIRPLEKVGLLTQGQLGQFSLQIDQRRAFLLPESAIIYREDKPHVRVIEGGKVAKKAIELGARMGDSFEVKTGLQEGEQIVIRTSRFVSDGESVNVEAPQKKM